MPFAARLEWGLGAVPSALLAAGFGFFLMMISSFGLWQMRKLSKPARSDPRDAIGMVGTVYLRLVLDGGADAHLLVDELVAAGIPVIVHATMARSTGERENLSFETAGRLDAAGIPIALQSGYESYVPKTRVVLFEAAVAAAHGLPRDRALRSITLGAAELLGIADRVGSLEVGKHGDVALFDGDPFEYTTHCVGTVIEGDVVSETVR